MPIIKSTTAITETVRNVEAMTKKLNSFNNKSFIIIIKLNSIYLRANLTAKRPITKRARVEKKIIIISNILVMVSNKNFTQILFGIIGLGVWQLILSVKFIF
jgi:hypothetical protein